MRKCLCLTAAQARRNIAAGRASYADLDRRDTWIRTSDGGYSLLREGIDLGLVVVEKGHTRLTAAGRKLLAGLDGETAN